MKTTLIVENNSKLQDFLAINLHTWVGSLAITAKDAKLATEQLLQHKSSINLIITRANVGTERTAEAIFRYLLDNGLDIPIIVIGDSPLAESGITHVFSALSIKEIIQYSAKELEVTAQDMANLAVPNYFEIPLNIFYEIKSSICPVYKEVNYNYELFSDAEIDLNYIEIKKLSDAGVTSFYVKKNDRLKFVGNINQEIAAKLSLDELNEDEQVSAVEMSQQLLQSKLKRMGITDETVELAQRNLKHMAKSAKTVSSLKHLLARLLKNKAEYQFRHSQILMFVATHLMNQMDWVNDEQRKKLQFIAFFHDISLTESRMSEIHTNEQLRKSDFTDQQKEEIKKHAQTSAALASQYPGAPVGVEQIIKQHHGMINGIGFSDHYSQNISPMAIVFILAEDFVDELLHAGKNFSAIEKIAQMKQRYSTQRFKKILDALAKIAI